MGDYVSDNSKKGWLTSIFELGAWLGTLYSGFLAEIISRKYAILVSTGVFIVGVVIQTTGATSAGSSSILGGRFITGMGVGALSMIVPMVCIGECNTSTDALRHKPLTLFCQYNAECAPPEVRGGLIGLQQLAITTGIMISFWIDYGV